MNNTNNTAQAAAQILTYLGYARAVSMEPGADSRRDRIQSIIESALLSTLRAPVTGRQSWPRAGKLEIECDPDRFGPAPWHITDGFHHAIGATPNEALTRFYHHIASAPVAGEARTEGGDPASPRDDSDRTYDKPIGYLPAYELGRLHSGHGANLRSAKFGPSALDGDVPVYLEPPNGDAAPQASEPPGEVVVTYDCDRIVAVTRQDDEGRILSVIAEAPAVAREAREVAGVTLDGCLETLFRVGEHLGINYAESRKQLGAPSSVYIKAIEDRISRASNAALEQAAKLMDQTSRSSGAALIRALKSTPSPTAAKPDVAGAPERIWLVLGEQHAPSFSDLAEVTWSAAKQFDGDIEYVRADRQQRAKEDA